jgi:hypothetical protein
MRGLAERLRSGASFKTGEARSGSAASVRASGKQSAPRPQTTWRRLYGRCGAYC